MRHSECIRLLVLVPALLLAAGCGGERRLTTDSPEALAAYHEGISHLEKFYYKEAGEAFTQALKADTAFAMARARLAVLSFMTDNEAEAQRQIRAAMTMSGSRLTDREQLFIRMWDRRIHFANDEAEKIASALLERHPGDAEAWVFKGGLLELRRDLNGALDAYRKAAEADSAYAPAAMMLGYAYSSSNDHERALAEMERYIRLVPGAADPRASYADLLLRLGRYEEALEQYRLSLTLKPDYWYSFNQTGSIYAMLGRLRDAEAQFEKGFRSLPPGAHLEATHTATLAGLQLARGAYDEAIGLYLQALRTDSTALNAAYGLAYTLTRAHKFAEAEATLARIRDELAKRNLLDSQPMLSYHLTRSAYAAERGLLEVARKAADEALAISTPQSRPSVYRQIADLRLRAGAYDDALDACGEALSVNPNAPGALLVLVKVYRAKGDPAMTREIGGRLLELWKNADPDFRDLQELKRVLGKGGAAS